MKNLPCWSEDSSSSVTLPQVKYDYGKQIIQRGEMLNTDCFLALQINGGLNLAALPSIKLINSGSRKQLIKSLLALAREGQSYN